METHFWRTFLLLFLLINLQGNLICFIYYGREAHRYSEKARKSLALTRAVIIDLYFFLKITIDQFNKVGKPKTSPVKY